MATKENNITIPHADILLMIVGTRGDVQPFIALGQVLLKAGHRVRLATHETFRKFVRGNGLEFYPLAGDPAVLMSFMVKNSGVVPSVSSIVEGDLSKNREILGEILASTWRACIADDDETGKPFTAEAIIANPPSFGHIHCAHKLLIPLHIMFTMPWSPTTAFPHPLVNVDYSRAAVEKVNMLSYSAIEMFTWSGMRDIVNDFRNNVLGLPSLHTRQATYMMIEEKVPYTYCWSPSIVPKPEDWADHINVSGFFFLEHDATADDKQNEDLIKFLGINNKKQDKSVTAPIYIGFGSITGHDSERILKAIIEALEKTGDRAVLLGLAKDDDKLPDNIFKVDAISHDWLFPHVSAVCHHGGAGTTAAGLRAGKPTIIVPFFGDQFFWGKIIEKHGCGPHAVPGKDITVDDFIEAFKFVHKPETKVAAERLRDAMLKEHGCDDAVSAFHSHLPIERMRSDLESTYAACYRLKHFHLQLSRRVAQVLVIAGRIDKSQLRLLSTRDWPSIYDNRVHVPFHGILKHSHQAVVAIYSDTSNGFKQAFHSDTWSKRTYSAMEGLLLGLGKGLGHLCIGCTSLYGEITDALEVAPSYYDPYNETSTGERPVVTNFETGVHAAILSLYHGWKEGIIDIVHTPTIGYERQGRLGGVAGAFIGLANGIVKPVAGTFSSLTWFCRGIYAHIKNNALTDKGLESSPVHTLGLDSTNINKERNQHSRNINQAASDVTGFSPEVCQRIISEFDDIQKQNKHYRSHEHKSR
ncbi:unnamed protein product [Adineta steineri]|uniref:Glycosyltransferase family 28 N-terminal domain-containing protein n=1 Tax=Adineta steineri TaxID=433720 RepID=A0A819MVS1_9BILA|nr:unnamed protein product [Adineta steineri]CAF3987461.1 unnamed protein product [Adineta steineri]